MKELVKKSEASLSEYDLSEEVTVADLQAEFFVETMIEEVSPRVSVLYKPTSKTLLGMVPKELGPKIGQEWKDKFKKIYNHIILEKDELPVEEERELLIAQNKAYYD